jgi:hypothetical protein
VSIEVDLRPAPREDLLGRAQRGEAEAFTALVDEHHAELVRIAYVVCGDVELARDAAQTAWIKAWRQLPSLREPETLRPWLIAIAAKDGYVGPRWGPDGRAALVCGPAPDCGKVPGAEDTLRGAVVRVLDPETRAETIVSGVQQFDGNPALIWAAIGPDPGFLFHDAQGWGVQPLDGAPVVRGEPRILSRGYRLAPAGSDGAELSDAFGIGKGWLGDLLAPALPVAGSNAADGAGIWLLLDQPRGSQHQAILVRLTGPGVVGTVNRFDMPTAAVGFAMSDDDTMVALDVGLDAPWPFMLAQVRDDLSTTTLGPVIDGLRVNLVPASVADGWPGD